MSLRTDSPYVSACCRDGTFWLLPISVLEEFRAAWRSGRPFWLGPGLYDTEIDIKLADITGITNHTAASIALRKAEDEIMRVREMVDGSDD